MTARASLPLSQAKRYARAAREFHIYRLGVDQRSVRIGHIYMVQMPTGETKIGRTVHLKRRAAEYEQHGGHVRKAFETVRDQIADLEASIHRTLRPFRAYRQREWFNISEIVVDRLFYTFFVNQSAELTSPQLVLLSDANSPRVKTDREWRLDIYRRMEELFARPPDEFRL